VLLRGKNVLLIVGWGRQLCQCGAGIDKQQAHNNNSGEWIGARSHQTFLRYCDLERSRELIVVRGSDEPIFLIYGSVRKAVPA
jgi:hypothetical protein